MREKSAMFSKVGTLMLFLSVSQCLGSGFIAKDVTVTSDAGKGVGICNLGATILLPKGQPPKALILLVHGSGTNNRDEFIPPSFRPFKDITEKLSSNGYATLRFDKRGSTAEGLPSVVNNKDLSPWHFVRDVENIIDYVNSDATLSQLPLILLGHSEGVNYVVEIALRSPARLKGLILLAGLGKYPIDATILRQFQQIVDSPLTPPATKGKYAELIKIGQEFFRRVRSGSALPEEGYMSVYSTYWQEWIAITDRAANSASRVRVPSLALAGTEDTNVTMEDFEALAAATKGVPGSNSRAYPGLHHLFMKETATTVDPEVLGTIVSWANTQFERVCPAGLVGASQVAPLQRGQ